MTEASLMEIETDYSFTFEVQLSEQHTRMNSAGRWDSAELAAKAAGEYLLVCAENGFTNVAVKVIPIEEYRPLGVSKDD